MAGKKDIVEQALRLIIGTGEEAASKAKLPMDLDNRMYRASEMGFDPTRRYYHLTRKDFDAFKLGADPSSHTGGGAIWLREDPRYNISAHQVPSFEAEGARDIPLFIRPTKELPTMEWSLLRQQGKLNDQFPLVVTPEENKMLRDMGYSHASLGGETVVFDPKDLRSPHAVFDPDEAESADYMKSSGGSIRQGYQTKGRVVGDIVDQALKLVMGAGDEAAPVSRIGMNYKDVTKRVPELTEAAKRLQAGEIGQSEYSAMVDRFKPVEPYASVPNPASVEDMVRALTANKREKIGKLADYPEGHPVALRLDIPAYTAHGVWVPTIHDQKTFKSISHEPAAHITGAQFSIPENKALAVAAGGAKGPFATIDGSLLKTPPEAIHERAKAAMNDPDWVQVGMDPERHSYFYDRKTMQPVLSAEEVIQVGPLVLARKPVYGNAEGFKYSKGGSARYGNNSISGALNVARGLNGGK